MTEDYVTYDIRDDRDVQIHPDQIILLLTQRCTYLSHGAIGLLIILRDEMIKDTKDYNSIHPICSSLTSLQKTFKPYI